MIIPDNRVSPARHPNSAQLKTESVVALEECKLNPGKWIVWQSSFPHHRASKVQAYNLRCGKRQKTLTLGYLDPDGDEILEFKAWKNLDTGVHCVIARLTTAEFRINERELGLTEEDVVV